MYGPYWQTLQEARFISNAIVDYTMSNAAMIGTGAILGAGALYRGYRRFRGRGRRKKKLAIRNAAKIRRLQQGFGHEKKTFDSVLSAAISTTGAITALSNMAIGDTHLTREGLQIRPASLEWKLDLRQHASATATTVRIIIFKDTQMSGTTPTVAELLELDAITSFMEHDTRPRFMVLRDMIFVFSINGNRVTYAAGGLKLKGKIWYTGSDASAAAQAKNNLFVYAVSNEAANTVANVMRFRLRFFDP